MASKRALRRRMCGEKRRYPTRAAALTALIRLIRVLPSLAVLRTYHCRFCHNYHFGHTDRVFRLRINRRLALSR